VKPNKIQYMKETN